MSKPVIATTLRTPLATNPAVYNDLRYVAADPRTAPGLAGTLGDLVYYENGPIRMVMQKVGSGATAWASVSKRPSALDQQNAADLQSLFRAVLGQPALAAMVERLWQPAVTAGPTVPDLITGAPAGSAFARIAGSDETAALLESGLGGAVSGCQGMYTLMTKNSSWALTDATVADVALEAFAIGGFFNPQVVGGGSYWLSKRGDTGNKPGYSLGITGTGSINITLVDTAAATVSVGIAQNHAPGTHAFVAGRSITNNIASLCTDMGRSTVASGALVSLTNAFPLGMDLRIFGAVATGMSGFITHLWFARGADAEAILANDIALTARLTGLMAN